MNLAPIYSCLVRHVSLNLRVNFTGLLFLAADAFKSELDRLAAEVNAPPLGPSAPLSPLSPVDDLNNFLMGGPIAPPLEMEPCVLCRESFDKTTLKEIKGRLFCGPCFETVNAKLRERKSSAKEKSNVVTKAFLPLLFLYFLCFFALTCYY